MINNKRVLITGGAGFIGKKLAYRLKELGGEIYIFDNLSEQIHGKNASFDEKLFNFIKGDVRDFDAISEAVLDKDIIFHLAAETGTGQSMYEITKYISVNEIGTANILEAISKQNVKPKKFILSSSRSIYGEGAYMNSSKEIFHPETRTLEDLNENKWNFKSEKFEDLYPIPTPISFTAKPASVYAATKLAQENLVKISGQALKMDIAILRFQNVYGEGQSLKNPYTGIISIFYNRMRQGLPINIYEDGKESRDFIHVDDVVDALISSMNSKEKNILANIGSGQQTSVLNLANILSKESGMKVPINVTGQFRLGDIRHCFADIECAKEILNFSPKINLENGIKKFIEWASRQPFFDDKSDLALEELSKKGMAKL